jgi:ribose 5-phosphate isomerase A
MMSQTESRQNWVPEKFQRAADNLAQNVVKRFVKKRQVIGLGSGPMAACIVRALADFDGKETLECIPSSFQIKLEAMCSGLKVVNESEIPEIDVSFDGADEVDKSLNMIKGGGGALLREKVIHSGTKQVVVIAAESNKFVRTFTWPVPIEVNPFAVHIVRKKLEDAGGRPKMRMLKEGYPYVTQNGNFILDTSFDFASNELDIPQHQKRLKNIPGVVEVGIFTPADASSYIYYKAKEDGSFETIGL